MPYINYDENENIIGIFANQQYEGQTFVNENSEKYKAYLQTQEKLTQKTNLQFQIDELDKKRIRAIAEPSQKDENITWLEYYTAQIIELRNQLVEL